MKCLMLQFPVSPGFGVFRESFVANGEAHQVFGLRIAWLSVFVASRGYVEMIAKLLARSIHHNISIDDLPKVTSAARADARKEGLAQAQAEIDTYREDAREAWEKYESARRKLAELHRFRRFLHEVALDMKEQDL